MKDISVFTSNKSETIVGDKQSTDPSVKTKVRPPLRCAPNKRTKNVGPIDTPANDSPKAHKPLKRIPSTFRWRSSPDIVEQSLNGMNFTISGTLKCLHMEDMVEMIEFCAGKVYKTLAKKSNYLVTGDNPSKSLIKIATKEGKTVLTEQQFLELVRDKSREHKFTAYRTKTADRQTVDRSDTESDICIISSDDDNHY